MSNNERTTSDTHEPKSDAEWSPKMIDDTLSPAVRKFVRLRKCGWEATLAPLLIGVLLMTAGCSHEEPSGAEAAEGEKVVNVAVSKVVRADLSQGLRIAAEFRPFQEINVYAKVPGYVKQIYVDVGDRVKKGQTLAVLEVPELQDELNQAAASGRQSEQEVEQARHELKRAEADHTVAHLTCQRLEGVMKTRPGLLAQQDVDDAQGKDQAAEARVEAAKAGLAGTQEHLYAATANRERVQALFDYTRIRAPFDGVVTARYADTGAMLAAGTSSEQQALPLVKLSQNAFLRLDIPVPETDVPSVRLGKKVSLEVQALNKSFEGTVARFADKVDSGTRTMMAEVDVPNPNLEIVPGMYAYVSFPIMEKKNALAVPIQAVSRQGNKAVAYRVNSDNRIEFLPVTIGIETRSQIEVLSGLSEGDRVVVGNTSQLWPGQIVAPKIVELSEVDGGN
jgi:RND family efflux transporter MFP subunit